MSTCLDHPHSRTPIGRPYRWWSEVPTHGSRVRLEPEPLEHPVSERSAQPLGAVLIAATVLLALGVGALVSLVVLADHVRGWLG